MGFQLLYKQEYITDTWFYRWQITIVIPFLPGKYYYPNGFEGWNIYPEGDY